MKRFTAAFLALILTFGSLCLPADLFDGLFMRAGAYTYGDYLYDVLDDGTVEITDYNGSASVLNIPGGIDGRLVTSIGEYAFYNCTSLTQITIPDSVTSIGYSAFYNCTSLTSISVSAGNKMFSSYDNVLYNKNKTTLIKCPDRKKSVDILDSVTRIEDYAFSYCTSLTEITIPDSVTSIGKIAFQSCISLTEITIPNSVTSIGYSAFNNCTSLTKITIPDSVKSIGELSSDIRKQGKSQ